MENVPRFWLDFMHTYSIEQLVEMKVFEQASFGKCPYYISTMNMVAKGYDGQVVHQLHTTRGGKIKVMTENDSYTYPANEILLALYKHVGG